MNTDIIASSIIPPHPRVTPSEQVSVYVPNAREGVRGIAKYKNDQFYVEDGVVSIKLDFLRNLSKEEIATHISSILVQATGNSSELLMSQDAITKALSDKLDRKELDSLSQLKVQLNNSEEQRKVAEQVRVNNEEARKISEELRNYNEELRNSNEKDRIAAELAREAKVDEISTDLENAIQFVPERVTDLEYVTLGAGSVNDSVYLKEGYEDGDAIVLEDCESYDDSVVFTPIIMQSLIYELSANGTYYTVKGKGNVISKTLIIPDFYNGLPVKYVDDNAFKNDTSIVTASIGMNVDRIGSSAFEGCTNLTSVILLRNVSHYYDDDYEGYRIVDYCVNGITGTAIRYRLNVNDSSELANFINGSSNVNGVTGTGYWEYLDGPAL